ncbi:hypothetical protein RM423_08475 [Jatrophihabitans sp. DSM 44399]|uniref:Uncharacterized protein n=1 Tax=Jatrophihabitans lederbergiae TaxID=3075547 RepID=A0ABU2J9X1_9ACTN|nr:hypothetical protein [Jatrophihabitans sp. DSM 44399]
MPHPQQTAAEARRQVERKAAGVGEPALCRLTHSDCGQEFQVTLTIAGASLL